MQAPDSDLLIVTMLSSSSAELHGVAARRSDLWPLILQHPNVYPELAEWILEQQQVLVAVDAPKPASSTPVPQLRLGLVVSLLVIPLILVGAGIGWLLDPGPFVSNATASRESASPAAPEQDPSGEPVQETPAPTVQPPSENEVMNATLEVPPLCAETFGVTGPSPVLTFVDGKVGGVPEDGSGPYLGESTIAAVDQPFLDGADHVLVTLGCFYGGDSGDTYFLLYDAELNLKANVEYWQHVNADRGPNPHRVSGSVNGSELTISVGDLQTVGDGSCYTCFGSLTQLVELTWDGSVYALTDTAYEAERGLVRSPDLDTLQEIIDAVSNYKEDSVKHYFSDPQLSRMWQLDAAGEGIFESDRETFFYPGTTIIECMPLPPDSTARTFPISGVMVYSEAPWSDSEPGDFICLTESGNPSQTLQGPQVTWLVRTDKAGTPDIYAFNTHFQ